MRWPWSKKPPDESRTPRLRVEKYIAPTPNPCVIPGHWMRCLECSYEWKERIEPDPWNGRHVYWCPQCTTREFGSVLLEDWRVRLKQRPPEAPEDRPPRIPFMS